MTYAYPLGLGAGTGIELEYMIVDAASGDVRPVADRLIEAQAGAILSEIEVGHIAWSNELALHVVELKTNGPVDTLAGLAARFQDHVSRVNDHLAGMGACLMPTAMHPWMDPATEFVRWPHEYGVVYETFDRIFDCTGHGWSNLQSCHINLAFANDEEFGRLHAAIRAVLPLLPALAASSPFKDGRATGLLDTRLDVYRTNARRVPSVSGRVVPERMFTRASYEGILLEGIYEDLAELDPEGTLRHEWVNARGAIARFDRGAIEIRVLDVQECPRADLAIAALVSAVVQRLADAASSPQEDLRALDEERLAGTLWRVARDGQKARVDDPTHLAALGLGAAGPLEVGEVWRALRARAERDGELRVEHAEPLDVILTEGPLALRMLRLTGEDPARSELRALARALCACLADGRLFVP